MDNPLEIIDNAIEEFTVAVDNLPKVNASKLGLDNRAGFIIIDVENQLIIAEGHNVRALEYYGGFEYLDDEAKVRFGDFTIYNTDGGDDRVGRCLSFFEETSES